MPSLSIVMPVYNEARTIRSAIERVLEVDYPCSVELVVVDDGSRDGTTEILGEFETRGVVVIRHLRNRGKGAAVRTGVERATGTHLIVLDADLEYSPADIPSMLVPVIAGKADHVFGTRVFGMNTRFQSFRFAMGGRVTTLAANVLYDSCLTDMHTCLKLLPVADFRRMRLLENGFGLDTELTARLLRAGVRPYEVPVSYNGRSMLDGKKISWRDGIRCIVILVKIRSERHPQLLATGTVIAAQPVPVPIPHPVPLPGPFGVTPGGSGQCAGADLGGHVRARSSVAAAAPEMYEAGANPGPVAAQTVSRRRRIMVVGPGFHFLGGLSVYTCRLVNALSDDHRVSVLLLHKLLPARFYPGGHRAGHDLTSLKYDGRARQVGNLNWYWGPQMWRAVRFLKQERPEILVLQWWTAAALHSYIALAFAARRLGVPVVIEFHETQDPGEAEVPLMAAYCRRFIPRLLALASGALVHNAHDLALLKKTYGADRIEKLAVEVVPHGPYDHLPVPPEQPGPVEMHSGGGTRLLFFGLIRPYKGLEDLITAFNALSPSDAESFTLTVVGETWEGWELPARLIADSPYRDRINFVNRYVTDAEAGSFFDRADAIVLPYRRGSASGPLQIAMSHGMHVVLYAVGGLVEAVKDYQGTVLVAPDDVEALQDALLDVGRRRDERFEDPHSWSETTAALGRVAQVLAQA